MLLQPLTLRAPDSAAWVSASSRTGTPRHRELFTEYAEEVDFVTAVALKWWQETVAVRIASNPDDAQAERKAWIDRPAGPASYPGLVALIRDFWLACHEINRQSSPTDRVPPWTLLLEWLLTGEYTQCVSVLACMPYWPVGLDAADEWV